ncbi:hypothetical protein EXU48_05310 [Occultella glacieicola]|uniref:Uncharacterized protein n=1 Tax=Occultella glacieicola TaxID=2518684 RepID=A0ABY2E7R1_9MICO|nr:hypothetical protein [Occultella glacieicola]TDE97597.1 hypothetical protein EXU48_05310 [Occultella glacieicola]
MSENRNHAASPAEPDAPTEAFGSESRDQDRPSIMEAATRLEAETAAAPGSSEPGGQPSWYEESLRDEAALRSEPVPVTHHAAGMSGAADAVPGYSPGSPAPRERARVGTIVWGLVLVLLGVVVVAIGLGFEVDLEVFLIGLLGIAGVGLLVGTAISALRGR